MGAGLRRSEILMRVFVRPLDSVLHWQEACSSR